MSPLICAAESDNVKVVEVLLKHGANVNGKGVDGKTALMGAVNRRNFAMAEMLIKSGANVNAQDNNGDSVLEYASNGSCSADGEKMVKYLLQNGANRDIRNNQGKTPLDNFNDWKHGYCDRIKDVLKNYNPNESKENHIFETILCVSPLKYSVFESSEISETSLLILERIIKEKDRDGNYCIDNALIEKKFSYLANNLHKEEYRILINNFFEESIEDKRNEEILIKVISSAKDETIIALSAKLRGIAFDKICENIKAYQNEKPMLEAIAISKERKHISILVQLIKEHLVSKNDFEYWKTLYEKIDEKNIAKTDKKIIQTIIDAELDERKEQIA